MQAARRLMLLPLALLIAGGWLVWHARGLGWPDNLLLIPAVLVQAVFVNALFGAMHESVHYGSFRTRWAADLLAFSVRGDPERRVRVGGVVTAVLPAPKV